MNRTHNDKGDWPVKKKSRDADMTAAEAELVVDVIETRKGVIDLVVIGESPLMFNRMSEKVKRDLLMPKGRKTAVERAMTLKHQPLEEFRSSPYTLRDSDEPTLLALPATAFKGAIKSAALDMPGAKKAEIGRLTYVRGEFVPIYGMPLLDMRVVRMADMRHTPDIRTRAVMREWAAIVTFVFVTPRLTEKAVINLLATAGMSVGVGDGRVEKGALSNGQFRVASLNDPDVQRLIKTGGRAAQVAAMATPDFYNDETEELYSWYRDEILRRGDQKKERPERVLAGQANGR